MASEMINIIIINVWGNSKCQISHINIDLCHQCGILILLLRHRRLYCKTSLAARSEEIKTAIFISCESVSVHY